MLGEHKRELVLSVKEHPQRLPRESEPFGCVRFPINIQLRIKPEKQGKDTTSYWNHGGDGRGFSFK